MSSALLLNSLVTASLVCAMTSCADAQSTAERVSTPQTCVGPAVESSRASREWQGSQLHVAIRNSDVGAVKRLIANKADVNEPDSFGDPSLIAALAPGVALEPLGPGEASQRRLAIEQERSAQKTIVGMLIQAGADVNRAGADGMTPLMTIAQWGSTTGDTEILRSLLQRGAHIDAQNHAGETALMIAARRGNTSLAEALVRSGAAKDLRNCDRQTAAQIAARHQEIVRLLGQ